MSASPWILESETGRYYMNWQNEYGENERRYSEELSGGHQVTQSHYKHDDYKTPRSESSTRISERSEYESNSTRYANSQKPRRESISVSRTAEPSAEYTDRGEPVKVYSESRSGYHKSGGYDPSRDVRVRDRAERRDSPPLSESSQTSRRNHTSAHTHERERDVVRSEVDDLSLGLGRVTVDDVVGSPRYTTVSASAPVHSGQWDHVDQKSETSQIPIYEDDKGPERDPPSRHLAQDKPSDYHEKGKAIVSIQPELSPIISTGRRHISGTDGDVEPLDDSYKVRNFDWQKFFRPGRVFSTLWTDAFAGTTNDSENNQFMSSYDGRGSRKRGINLNEHGLIFSSEKKPSSVKGIEKLPLRVRLSKGADRLNNPSYINYGRVYSVETNVKVKDVGELDSESRKYLRAYYNQVNTLPEDDYDGPGPARNPQARAVELAGVGSGIAGQPFSGYPGQQQSSYGPLGPVTAMRGNYGGPQDRSPSYNQYTTSTWTAAGTQQGAVHTGHPLYNPAGSTTPTSLRYSTAPTYDMSRAPSNYQTPDNRYVPAVPVHSGNTMYQPTLDNYPRVDSRSYASNPTTPPYTPGAVPASIANYPRRDSDDRREFPSQPVDDRRTSFESRNNRDSYGSIPSPMERQQSWNQPQGPPSGPDPRYVDPRHDESQYADRNIDLPTLEEAQASRQRRESVGGRPGGRDSDRHRRRR